MDGWEENSADIWISRIIT